MATPVNGCDTVFRGVCGTGLSAIQRGVAIALVIPGGSAVHYSGGFTATNAQEMGARDIPGAGERVFSNGPSGMASERCEGLEMPERCETILPRHWVG